MLFLCSDQLKKLRRVQKALKAVKHQHHVDLIRPNIFPDIAPVVTEVKQVYLRKELAEKRRQTVGLGVAEYQNARPVAFRANHAQGLVATEKIGVLVLRLQLIRHIQLARYILSGEVGSYLNAVL